MKQRTSSQLNSKSNDKDYKVNVNSVLKQSTLDLTDDEFKGKVVYVNVEDSSELERLVASTGQLNIKK